MAGVIINADHDGSSIPAALAAIPSSKKRKAVKPAKLEAATHEASPAESPLAVLVEAEHAIDAAPEPVILSEPVAPEPKAVAPEPDDVPAPPAAVPAEPQKEAVMATTIENVTTDTTAKAHAMFADASERTKGAVAKSAKLFEDAGAFGKGNVEALVESSKIAAKGMETLGQDAAEFTRKSFEEATAAFKTMASVKSPTDFMKLQSDYIRSAFDAMVAETSRSTETVLKLAGEVAQPISNRFAVAAEKMKIAA